MKFRNEQVREVLVIENCDAKTLEAQLSEITGKVVDVQYSTTKGWGGKTLHSALVLIGSNYREKYD